jgi:hypothetical protein
VVLLACTQGGVSPPAAERETAFGVFAVVARGAYLDAQLERPGETLRLLFPAASDCRALIRTEAQLEYIARGPFGTFRAAGRSCRPVGVASLREWLDRHPRTGSGPVPRAQASFRPFYEDQEVLMVRGRFPLAALIGWAGASDAVALLAASAECREIHERGVASMEFREASRTPFTLVARHDRCAIQGFAQPLAAGEPAAAPETPQTRSRPVLDTGVSAGSFASMRHTREGTVEAPIELRAPRPDRK